MENIKLSTNLSDIAEIPYQFISIFNKLGLNTIGDILIINDHTLEFDLSNISSELKKEILHLKKKYDYLLPNSINEGPVLEDYTLDTNMYDTYLPYSFVRGILRHYDDETLRTFITIPYKRIMGTRTYGPRKISTYLEFLKDYKYLLKKLEKTEETENVNHEDSLELKDLDKIELLERIQNVISDKKAIAIKKKDLLNELNDILKKEEEMKKREDMLRAYLDAKEVEEEINENAFIKKLINEEK